MLHNIVGGVRGVGRGERWWWTGGRGKDLRLTFGRPCHSQICRYLEGRGRALERYLRLKSRRKGNL